MPSVKEEEYFACLNVSPAQMDFLWADGWRHFGIYFFRYQTSFHGNQKFSVIPLRIDVERFILSRSQKRVLAKNRDAEIVIRPASIDDDRTNLFEKHRVRFQENIPTSLDDVLSSSPASIPCPARELCVYLSGRLVGVTYLDIGRSAVSAVYAIFDPIQARRSLGILMILHSLQFSRARGCRYYYPGYAYREPFTYDYKKRFHGLEYLDWSSGWRPWPYEHDNSVHDCRDSKSRSGTAL